MVLIDKPVETVERKALVLAECQNLTLGACRLDRL